MDKMTKQEVALLLSDIEKDLEELHIPKKEHWKIQEIMDAAQRRIQNNIQAENNLKGVEKDSV